MQLMLLAPKSSFLQVHLLDTTVSSFALLQVHIFRVYTEMQWHCNAIRTFQANCKAACSCVVSFVLEAQHKLCTQVMKDSVPCTGADCNQVLRRCKSSLGWPRWGPLRPCPGARW